LGGARLAAPFEKEVPMAARNGFAHQRLLLGSAGGFLLLMTATLGYYRWANLVPAFRPPQTTPSEPGARAELVKVSDALRTPPGVTTNTLRDGAFDPSAPLPELRQMVAANRETLASGRLAATTLPYSEPPQWGFDARYPHLAKFRNLARAFAAESRVALAAGDPDEAAAAAFAAMVLGSKVPRGGPLISGLVGIAVHAIGYAALEPVLPRLSPAATGRALARTRALREQWPTFADSLNWEYTFARWGLIKELNRMSAMPPAEAARAWSQLLAGPEGDQRPEAETNAAGLLLAFTPKRAALASFDAYYGQLIAEARKPWGEGGTPPEPTDPINRLLLPAVSRAHLRWVETDAQLAALETWLAARRYQQSVGHPAPDEAHLARGAHGLPVDPFSHQPCVYRARSDAFLVYSVGQDGQDDGGRPLSLRQRKEGARGDLVVGRMYPPRDTARRSGSPDR
jgi:hypothetical protein